MVRVRDNFPTIRSAGRVFPNPQGGIAAELRQQSVPPTPERVRPFRKSYFARVGVAGRHYGARNDPALPDRRFGCQGEHEDTVETILAATNKSGLGAISAEFAETKYRRNKLEPLGRGPQSPYPLPAKFSATNFAFGIASDASENAKSVIYAPTPQEDAAAAAGGRLPHRTVVAPAAQRTRNYDWARVGIDPTKYRFGASSNRGPTESTKSLFEQPSVTHVMPLKVEAQRQSASANLEASRRSMLSYSHTTTFGRPPAVGSETLWESICGENAAPDAQLGHSVCKSATLRKLRESDPTADPTRVFGCPTVRLDLPKPKRKKVSSGTNYGDDATAAALLYPNPHAATEEAYLVPMSLEEIQQLFASTTSGVQPEMVARAFASARKNADGRVTLNDFGPALDRCE